MTLARTATGINKTEDTGRKDVQIGFVDALRWVFPTTVARLSHVLWLGSPGGNRESAGLIVVWQMCYPVQHALDAAASMTSSVTFRGILLRAVSGCCYKNGGLRNTAINMIELRPYQQDLLRQVDNSLAADPKARVMMQPAHRRRQNRNRRRIAGKLAGRWEQGSLAHPSQGTCRADP